MDKDSHLNLWNLCPSFESVYIKAKTFAKVDFFFRTRVERIRTDSYLVSRLRGAYSDT